MNMVGLPPGKIITDVGRDVDIEPLVQIGRDRLAQRQDADRRRVAVMAVAQRLDRRLDDEIRRAKIRLADAEIDDVAALRGERVARASTAKAFSSPMRSKAATVFSMAAIELNCAGKGKLRGPSCCIAT